MREREDIEREPVRERESREAPRLSDELFPEEIRGRHQKRWESIQTSFVDDPRRAVQEADALVSELTNQIQESFARQRQRLEGAWQEGGEASTEDLRRTLQQYRAYFTRLLRM
jgi:hypothetical protein